MYNKKIMNHTKDIIVNKYLLLNIIGNGKFGTIYKGKNIRNNEFVAIKTESPEQTLKHETKMLNYLYSNNCIGMEFSKRKIV